ncbi:class I SAM-dependent methyltransferase [Myxococcota bacterium]
MTLSDIHDHYRSGYEANRLTDGAGRLEWLRTMEIIGRYFPSSPAMILDVGGGAGAYAIPLGRLGYRVKLIDPVARHIELATAAAAEAGLQRVSAELGDARELQAEDSSADAVLFLGPLYHLTEKTDRASAIGEACRVLRPGGRIITAAISRFASTCDGIRQGYLREAEFEHIVERDLTDGQHRNDTDNPCWFTTAYFHRPEELLAEVREGGFSDVEILAVEGPAWLSSRLEEWLQEEETTEILLRAIRRVESEPSLWGASAHLVAVGRKA